MTKYSILINWRRRRCKVRENENTVLLAECSSCSTDLCMLPFSCINVPGSSPYGCRRRNIPYGAPIRLWIVFGTVFYFSTSRLVKPLIFISYPSHSYQMSRYWRPSRLSLSSDCNSPVVSNCLFWLSVYSGFQKHRKHTRLVWLTIVEATDCRYILNLCV